MAGGPVSAIDAVFLDLERPATPSVLAGFFIVDPATAPDHFVRHRDVLGYVAGRLHLAPALRRKLVFNPLRLEEPRLVEDSAFDLEFHVRHIALPSPHDERQLKILTARLFSRPMDLNRPLWELYVIEGLNKVAAIPRDAFAVLFKLHHTAFDGIAAMTAIFAMLQRSADEKPAPPEVAWQPPPPRTAFNWLWGSYVHAVTQAMGNVAAFPALAQSAQKQAAATVRSALDRGRATAPRTRFQSVASSHRVFEWVRLPMDRVKAVRAALGRPKINDLAVCIVAGALRRYLEHHGELPETSLMVACPVNIRGGGEAAEAGNRITIMILPMGTDITDPIARLAAIAAASSLKKAEVEAQGGGFAVSALALCPYAMRSLAAKGLVKLMATGRMAPIANTVVTNVPNPPGDFFFAGARMLTYAGLGPVYDQFGLFHTVTSLEWELSISATSCREVMPDIALYMRFMREAFEELEQCAGLPISVTTGVRKRPRVVSQPVGAGQR